MPVLGPIAAIRLLLAYAVANFSLYSLLSTSWTRLLASLGPFRNNSALEPSCPYCDPPSYRGCRLSHHSGVAASLQVETMSPEDIDIPRTSSPVETSNPSDINPYTDVPPPLPQPDYPLTPLTLGDGSTLFVPSTTTSPEISQSVHDASPPARYKPHLEIDDSHSAADNTRPQKRYLLAFGLPDVEMPVALSSTHPAPHVPGSAEVPGAQQSPTTRRSGRRSSLRERMGGKVDGLFIRTDTWRSKSSLAVLSDEQEG
ncbi:hypothetical protein PUNSTDRAFT_125711 [Punctularia strigosozonata HHB-11173 SS5]|uniref:uncharacterized protein n=1 Tax=Punctularia strigosozonata (strain HHB-11173) TaxID=741275 RepID=UPI000441695D|nr:uncharacterized protein PUNSTDRAFT_125711 [Punctularia strigosozonata HHB-11173 SS5]EIN09484.1 hypothetical protein PUNSTDRAFT_125711 [Punctularia strigosozonata HHB-11173 SS5]